MNKTNGFENAVSLLPAALRQTVMRLPDELGQRVQEIRLRQNAPLILSAPEGDYFVTESGQARQRPEGRLLICTGSHLSDCFQILCDFSVHTHQPEIRRGYIAARNGCRAGVAGTAVTEQGQIVSVRNITSLCLRVSRCHNGCARELAHWLSAERRLCSALICGEPASGKTSLLKDLARGFSMGDYGGGCRVAVVDERGELSNGGGLSLCDVLLHYPKAEGIEQAVRCLAPETVLFDELGTVAETEAVLAGLNSGVTAVATAHCHDLKSLLRRPQVRMALERGAFEHIVLLEGRGQPGHIRRILSTAEVLSSGLSPSDGGKEEC